MSSPQGVVFDPEELSLLGRVFDQAIASLPSSMRTPAKTMEIAKIILERAVAGERDPIKLEFAALSPGVLVDDLHVDVRDARSD